MFKHLQGPVSLILILFSVANSMAAGRNVYLFKVFFGFDPKETRYAVGHIEGQDDITTSKPGIQKNLRSLCFYSLKNNKLLECQDVTAELSTTRGKLPSHFSGFGEHDSKARLEMASYFQKKHPDWKYQSGFDVKLPVGGTLDCRHQNEKCIVEFSLDTGTLQRKRFFETFHKVADKGSKDWTIDFNPVLREAHNSHLSTSGKYICYEFEIKAASAMYDDREELVYCAELPKL
jgi:hypothetical protein